MPLDLDEEGHLSAGDAERMYLAPQLADELKQNGAEPVCDVDWSSDAGCVHTLTMLTKLVRMVNDLTRYSRGRRTARSGGADRFPVGVLRWGGSGSGSRYRRRPRQACLSSWRSSAAGSTTRSPLCA